MSFSNPPPTATIGRLQYRWALQHARGQVVGGDALFLEQNRQDEGAMFLLVDAEGHGAHAAQIVRVIDAQLRRSATLGTRRPGELLTDLHRRLSPIWAIQGTTDHFVGAYAVLLDSTHARVEVACAGMPNPIRISTERGPSLIEIPRGPWLGVSDAQEPIYPVTEITLERGEYLWFCSRGATDARPPDAGQAASLRAIGLGRLIGSVVRKEPEHEVFPVLFSELAELQQGEWAQDDTIFLSIRYPEAGREAPGDRLSTPRPDAHQRVSELRSLR